MASQTDWICLHVNFGELHSLAATLPWVGSPAPAGLCVEWLCACVGFLWVNHHQQSSPQRSGDATEALGGLHLLFKMDL